MTTQELYLKTIFCCMACDGDIAQEELAIVKKMATNTDLFGTLDVESTINNYVKEINSSGVRFLNGYLNELSETKLSDDEQLVIVRLSIETIEADNKIEYAEVKFFKKIRSRMSLSDEQILEQYPDKEDWLLPDINVAEDPVWENVEFENIDLSSYEQN